MTIESLPPLPGWNLQGIPHNWTSSCQVETAFQTTVTSSADGVREERRILLPHPARTLTFNWRGVTRERMNRILTQIRNMSSGRWVVPLYPDQAELDQDYVSGTTIYCDTTLKRFFPNQRILVLGFHTQQWAEIDEVHADRLVLKSALSAPYGAGATLIFPCIEVEPLLIPTITMITSRVGDLSIPALEIIGPSCLPGHTGVPPEFSEHAGFPIMHLEHNWVDSLSVTFAREGSLDNLGRGRVFYLRGDKPRMVLEPSLLLTREIGFPFIQFFEDRKGRAKPFWMNDPEDVWEILSYNAGGMDIAPLGDFVDFEADFERVAIRDVYGALHISEVTSLTDFGTYWRIAATMPGLVPEIASRARFVRFNRDVLTEEWVTTEVVRLRFEVIELLEEAP